MSEPARFLNALAQTLSTMALYTEGHPARERSIDGSFRQLRDLQHADPRPQFSFLGEEVIYGQVALRELTEWQWGARLANAGIQRLEFADIVSREEYEAFLEEVLARLTLAFIDTAEARPARPSNIRFGAVGIRGDGKILREMAEAPIRTATITYDMREEAEAVQWLHQTVSNRGELPLMEAEAVVRSLSVAMHGDDQMMLPLLQLKEYDQYTTTHSINVSVLTMALAEFLELGAREVRAFGVAGLLHDLGKVRIPRDILNKPGKLTEHEREVIQRHPVDGARIIFQSEKPLDLAAVVAYEHHIMLNGGGYPHTCYKRDCHQASHLVHVCDVYDALRTRRPYREAWESEDALAYIESHAGTEFDPEVVQPFLAMMRQWDRRTATLGQDTPGQDTPGQDTPGQDTPGQDGAGKNGAADPP